MGIGQKRGSRDRKAWDKSKPEVIPLAINTTREEDVSFSVQNVVSPKSKLDPEAIQKLVE